MTRKSKRGIKRLIEELAESGSTDAAEYQVENDVVDVRSTTDPEPEPPENATLLETESPVVTVWEIRE